MAIMFVRAQVISRGAGRSIVSAAAYRHRSKMMDEQAGTEFRYVGGVAELVHEALALPEEAPTWLRAAIDGRTVAGASEALWNAVDRFEKRADAQLARELIFALPEELTRSENIALVEDFVHEHLTSHGMVADWVYHDKDGNPHVHIMTTLRPLTEQGFGPKKVPVVGEDGKALRVATPDRPNGKIVYHLWAGDKETMKAWKVAWAETANRYLALAGHDIRLDGRSYAEQGLEGIAQKHLGPAKAALARKGAAMFLAPAELARRQHMADRLADDPGLLLKQLSNERSTFDEQDIAKALHRYVDDPSVFANIRAKLMASSDLTMLRPQQFDTDTGAVIESAVFTTRDTLRTEYDMANSASELSKRRGFSVVQRHIENAIASIETRDPQKPFTFDAEQIDAVRHVTADTAIAAVVGLAGTGKSTLLEAARLAWETDGRTVFGAALAGKAAEGLEESSGIRSRTLASWELSWANDRDRLEKGDVFVIDEAGMVSSQQLARVIKVVEEAQAKVVLVGDAMQLQPIQAGAAFRAIVERIGFAELAGVRRQSQDWARDASRLFARGDVDKGLDLYSRHGHLTVAETRDEAINRIVQDWTRARRQLSSGSEVGDRRLRGDALLVLAHTNADVKRLNDALRAVMMEENALGVARSFATERGTRDFASGDRIVFLENARFVDPGAKHLGPQYVKNGMLGTVLSTTDRTGETLLAVRLDSGREVVFGEDSYRSVDHGYATTIHKSQGSTVDRTFVLATGMMDQHLTYVAMTRHRHQADLYAARKDFERKLEFGKARRADHAAGVTGELLDLGLAQFREKQDSDPSRYADVRTDDGAVHRLWGVSLPKAIEAGGVALGDTVTLHKDGVEHVTVTVPVTDEDTGDKRFEERVVTRNVWTAKQVEPAEVRRERLEAERHRPDLFSHLVERLSRSGAKTTTLDFDSEDGYQRHIADFGYRRGIDTLSQMAAGTEEAVDRRLTWIATQAEKVAELWQRASVALGFTIERERRQNYSDLVMPSKSVASTVHAEKAEYLLAPTTAFSRSVEEHACLAQLASPAWKERESVLHPLLARIYRDADDALVRLNDRASTADIAPRHLGETLARSPEQLGCLHGSNNLVDGHRARKERGDAIDTVAELVPLARAHAAQFKADAERSARREHTRREHMSLSVPALSRKALERLGEIEAIRERGGQAAYRSAFALAAEDRSVIQEIMAVSEALSARFGWSAFTEKADPIAERNVKERMPEGLGESRSAELAQLFSAVKRFSAEQHLAEKRDPSRIVAAAPHQGRADNDGVPPMLAAVAEFKVPIEIEAHRRAVNTGHYKQHRGALADVAVRVWRDPAAAVSTIERLIGERTDGERIARAVANDPAAYGALRGSERIMDRLLASGRERRDALQAVGEVTVKVRLIGASYASAFEAESRAVGEERARMAVAIPRLTVVAENELKRIMAQVAKNPRDLTTIVRGLDPSVRAEFAVVGKALNDRFGPGAVMRDEKHVMNMIPDSQRKAFEAMRGSLRTLQQAVRADETQKIVEGRQTRALNRRPPSYDRKDE